MTSSWTKIFKSDIAGTIALSESELKSWNKSFSKELHGVFLTAENNGKVAMVSLFNGPGNYHQSDDYESTWRNICPEKIVRRIQFQRKDKKWITKEIDLRTLTTREYISEHKI